MKRMSAPPSSISVAIVCRNMWHDPCLLICAAFTYMLTSSVAVLLAVVEHVTLIGFEHRASHFHWLGDATVGHPFQEEADMNTPPLDGVLGVVFRAQVFEMFSHQQRQRRGWALNRFT